ELLVGKRPFTGNNPEIMRAVLNDRPVSPSETNSQVAAQLDWAIHKSLAKNKPDRFQSAREFSDAFVKGIEASIRHSMQEPDSDPGSETTTQRMDDNLIQAARLLAGLQPQPTPSGIAVPPTVTAGPPVAAPSPAAAPIKRARILFVDDEERIVAALRSVFRSNYHVFTAVNGPEALEFVKKFRPHVIVSDQRMPAMTGVQLLRQVKEASPNTVRILLTGYSDLAAIVGSINEGEVFRFVSKPWDNQEIQRIIGQAVAIAYELAEAATNPAVVVDKMSAGILVVDPAEESFRAIKELFAVTCPIRHAANLDAAFAVLQEQEIGLIVADIENGREEATATFKLLKQEHPEILAIVLTDASDSELVIELINQAQIFRFVNKPVNLKLLTQHAQAALARYQAFKQQPQLAQQHKVASANVGDSLAEKIRMRIGSLRSWLRPVIR